MHLTTLEEFKELAQRGTFVPVCKEIVADMLTPVSAFLKIAEHSDHAFLLESVEGGEHVGRYSFLGKDPFLVLRSRGGRTILESAGETTDSEKPLVATMRELMARYRSPFVPGLPRFTGGAVGFLGYDAVGEFEEVLRVARNDGGVAQNDNSVAQGDTVDDDAATFMFFDTVLAFDHVRHRILIIANARITGDEDLESLYRFSCAKIAFLERELDRSLSKPSRQKAPPLAITSNLSREEFEAIVRMAKEYVAAGDVYQVVLSQRFETAIETDPFTVYRALRHVSPAPYMYFLRIGGRSIVGSSPEMLVRVEGRRVETRPIAGTRPRGRNETEDARLADELRRDEKERAEHVMLVDLSRNDVGRVAKYGSVRVPTYMTLERFSHVMHLVSAVEGELAEARDQLDALAACFPAGTVSGAPKVRAMQLIAELENRRRGAYAGAVGYLDFAGNLDFCITIRTVVMERGRAYVQAGAGIVADSNPSMEYDETREKARAVLEALEMANAAF
jgi:anthranilate synthase component 1